MTFTDFKPFTTEQLERNLAIAFKDAVYPTDTPYAPSLDVKTFAIEYLKDYKQELLEHEQYEKLCQFHQMERIYCLYIP